MNSRSNEHQSVVDFIGRWWLIQTRPQYEMRLSQELSAAGVSHFLPTEQIRRRKSDRGRTYLSTETRVLFPGYLFVRGSWDDRDVVARSKATCAVREVADGMQSRLSTELVALEKLCDSDVPTLPMCDYREGEFVQVIAGPLIGCRGIFERRANQGLLLLSVSILGAARPVEMPPEFVERLN